MADLREQLLQLQPATLLSPLSQPITTTMNDSQQQQPQVSNTTTVNHTTTSTNRSKHHAAPATTTATTTTVMVTVMAVMGKAVMTDHVCTPPLFLCILDSSTTTTQLR
jgi:pyruvate/2-oxoglutarate dehydrogenase complex dihydrolipoamide acyltransferase (E2) component